MCGYVVEARPGPVWLRPCNGAFKINKTFVYLQEQFVPDGLLSNCSARKDHR